MPVIVAGAILMVLAIVIGAVAVWLFNSPAQGLAALLFWLAVVVGVVGFALTQYGLIAKALACS